MANVGGIGLAVVLLLGGGEAHFVWNEARTSTTGPDYGTFDTGS